MLNQNFGTNNSAAEQAMMASLLEDLLHHRRQNSEDSGLGEGKFREGEKEKIDHFILFFPSGRNSINRTPDALSSMDCMDDPMDSNQTGMSQIDRLSTERKVGMIF